NRAAFWPSFLNGPSATCQVGSHAEEARRRCCRRIIAIEQQNHEIGACNSKYMGKIPARNEDAKNECWKCSRPVWSAGEDDSALRGHRTHNAGAGGKRLSRLFAGGHPSAGIPAPSAGTGLFHRGMPTTDDALSRQVARQP